MLARPYRFHGHASIQRVYSRGQITRAAMFSIKYMPENHRQGFRLAVVVSRKVHGSAVVRNRIRRRIYEQVRLGRPARSADIVITVYDSALATIPAVQLSSQLARAMQKMQSTYW